MSTNKIVYILIILFFFINIKIYSQPRKSAEYYYLKGKIQYEYEIFNYSEENLKRALRKNNNHFKAANLLALLYIKNKKYNEAIDIYNLSLKINFNQSDTHTALGRLYYFFARVEKAFTHFKEAIKIDPGDGMAHFHISQCYYYNNNYDLGEKSFNKSFNLNKEKSESLEKKGLKNSIEESYENALTDFKDAILKNPASIESYKEIIYIYRKQDNYKMIKKYLEKLKSIRPDIENTYIRLANHYLDKRTDGKRIDNINKAILNFKKAIKINPNNEETIIALSNIYFNINKKIIAEKILERLNHIKK